MYSFKTVSIITFLFLFSCKPTEKTILTDEVRQSIRIEAFPGNAPYSSLDLNNDPDQFQFAIVTDRTGGHRPGVFEDGISKLNLLQPEFVMSVGDLIEGYTEDRATLDAEWEEFTGFIDELEMPFFYLPGNHDITNKVMEEVWKEKFGKTYYSFVYKDVLFLCLNSEDNYRGSNKGTIDEEQYSWIAKTLEANQSVKWTLVFLHQPLWVQENDTKRWQDVEKLLSGRKHTVFAGHRHSYVKYERNDSKYFILGTTGGASGLRGPQLGEFDHVVWVTMNGEGPQIANLQLEGIWNEDVFTEDMADYFRPIVNTLPIKIMPMYYSKEHFQAGKTEMKITNNGNAPMNVHFDIDTDEQVSVSPRRFDVEVPPNDVKIVSLDVQPLDTELRVIKPIVINGKVTFRGIGFPEVSIDQQMVMSPERKNLLQQSKKSVVLDGDLSEWGELPYRNNEMNTIANPFAHTGDQDGQVAFQLSYDEEFLYVGASIIDDELLPSKSDRLTDGDAFLVLIDPNEERKSAYNNGLNGTFFIGISPSYAGETNDELFLSSKDLEGAKGKLVKTANGYNVELKIPLEAITKVQGKDWKTIRVNAGINDFDKDYEHNAALLWKPDWRGDMNYAGSGMLFRVLGD